MRLSLIIVAGVIAAIAIGAAVVVVLLGLGGKKGYDYYMANKADIHDGQVSPMYKDPGNKGTNPFYAEMSNKA